MTENLKTALLRLYNRISEIVNTAKANGELISIPHEYIPAGNLDFSTGHTSYHYEWDNIEYYTLYKWSTPVFNEYLNKLRVLPEVEAAYELIRNNYKIPEERAELAKGFFVHAILPPFMNSIPNGEINDENIESYLDLFINDYEIQSRDELYTWDVNVWLCCFETESDTIQLHDCVLRRPVVSELGLVRQKRQHIDEFEKMFNKSIASTTVLQFTVTGKKQSTGVPGDDIKHEIEARLDTLRLYKLANIYVQYQTIHPRSVLEYKHSDSPGSQFDKTWTDKLDYQQISDYKCWIPEKENEPLATFYKKVKPLLKGISPKNYLSGSYLDLAVHRYKDALLRSEVNVNRMVSAITCIEALFSDSNGEITFKIKVRIAGLLRHFGFNTIRVLDKLGSAYNIRSLVIHGSNLKNPSLEFSKEHTHEILNYARIGLLVSLQLKNKLPKDQLIKHLDHSLIDDSSFEEMKSLIDQHVFIPSLYPFRRMENGDDFKKKQIACIGWGSLIWNPENLKCTNEWQSNGPLLPIEFTRISKDKRVTLIIDEAAKPIQTLWSLMNTENLREAIESLKEREKSEKIDFVTATEASEDPVKHKIIEWLRLYHLDAAIWTSLSYKQNSTRPSIDDIVAHLKSLNQSDRTRAEEYVRKAPKQIMTEYRKRIEEELGWAPTE